MIKAKTDHVLALPEAEGACQDTDFPKVPEWDRE